MTRRQSPSRGLVLALLLASGAWGVATAQTSPKHPSLVTEDATACRTCHGDILEGRPHAHEPAADDCGTCHEVTISETGTTIALVDDDPALCLTCHPQLSAAVGAEVEVPHFPVTESCGTCHDPHASDELRLLLSPAPELCGTCHDAGDLDRSHGGQLTSKTDCAACHQPHGSPNEHMLRARRLHKPFAEGSCSGCHRPRLGDRMRLRARGERLCEACHGSKTDPQEEGGSVHAALRGEGGVAGCLSCHDPHLGDEAGLVREAGAALCSACHGEIVAAARDETGHAPAGEDCLSCHLPHASGEASLLTAPAGELCRTCHDPGDDALKTAHLGADPDALECTSCHTPHGAGHDKLLAKNLHPPLLDGCDTCHEGPAAGLADGGESSLCLVCHDAIGEVADQASVPHAAMELGSCTVCHNPHASEQDRLVKLPGGGECAECHEDQTAGAGETAHGVIAAIGCRSCHEPHGGSREKLLRKPPNELCLSCHGPGAVPEGEAPRTVRLLDRYELTAEKVREMASLRLSPDGLQGHPVARHRVSGRPTVDELERTETTFRDELTCLTCHDPHKGRSKELLKWNAASAQESCRHCHPK